MPYAVVGYFDLLSDRRIRSIWRRYAENEVSSYLWHSNNNPHIKLAVFNELEADRMQRELEQFCRECQRLKLHFKNYGLYPGKQPVLFLDVSATIELLELQMAVRRTLSGIGQEMEGDYFEPGIWKPDCYLTTGFDPDRLNEAIHILNQEPLPFDGYLERIGLIKYYPAEQCYDYRLQE